MSRDRPAALEARRPSGRPAARASISAAGRDWNSATTLYVARRIAEIAGGRTISVLDMGCGDGTVLEHLLDYGHDLYGYELVEHEDHYAEVRRERLLRHFGAGYDLHIRVTRSERQIPFADGSFDVVYANQVFEHVRFFETMIAECARVLRPSGTLLANFPLATYPIEGHIRVPFVHWLPPGPLRVRYLELCSRLGLLARQPGRTARQTAVAQDRYLREETFYRFANEVAAVAGHYFERCEIETGAFVRAKIDLLLAHGGRSSAVGAVLDRLDGRTLHACVTHLYNAAFCMTGPKRHGDASTSR